MTAGGEGSSSTRAGRADLDPRRCAPRSLDSKPLFPAAAAARPLLVGVVLATFRAVPVPLSGPADALLPGRIDAGRAAVPVAPVARPADGERPLAPTAGQQQEQHQPGRCAVPAPALDIAPAPGVLLALDGLAGHAAGRPRGLGGATPSPHSRRGEKPSRPATYSAISSTGLSRITRSCVSNDTLQPSSAHWAASWVLTRQDHRAT